VVTVTKADFAIPPVSPRYGARVIEDGGRRVGYLNLRTFISTADPQLRAAFDGFRTQGISEVIVDFRYNGGGLVSTAELMGDLLGRNRTRQEVFSHTTFRPRSRSLTKRASSIPSRNRSPPPRSRSSVRAARRRQASS
jgi:C-terminal processing protease CtpA/Prc